jgi:hypothetical protein
MSLGGEVEGLDGGGGLQLGKFAIEWCSPHHMTPHSKKWKSQAPAQ